MATAKQRIPKQRVRIQATCKQFELDMVVEGDKNINRFLKQIQTNYRAMNSEQVQHYFRRRKRVKKPLFNRDAEPLTVTIQTL